MQHAAQLPNTRNLLIALVAFAIGVAAATTTYAAIDNDWIESATTSSQATAVKVVPHAGTGGVVAPAPPASTARRGGGPPAEPSPAQEATKNARTDPHGPASTTHSASGGS